MMTKQEFREWFEQRSAASWLPFAQSIIGPGMTFAPMLLICFEDGVETPVRIDEFGDIETKDRVASIQRSVARMPSVRACLFMCETWALSIPKGADEKAYRGKHESLETHPDRMERFMINAMAADTQILGMAEIIRPDNRLGKFEVMADRIEGRMSLDPDKEP